jgi:hypothetical protein
VKRWAKPDENPRRSHQIRGPRSVMVPLYSDKCDREAIVSIGLGFSSLLSRQTLDRRDATIPHRRRTRWPWSPPGGPGNDRPRKRFRSVELRLITPPPNTCDPPVREAKGWHHGQLTRASASPWMAQGHCDPVPHRNGDPPVVECPFVRPDELARLEFALPTFLRSQGPRVTPPFCAALQDVTRTRPRAAAHRADPRDGTAGGGGYPGGTRRDRYRDACKCR